MFRGRFTLWRNNRTQLGAVHIDENATTELSNANTLARALLSEIIKRRKIFSS